MLVAAAQSAYPLFSPSPLATQSTRSSVHIFKDLGIIAPPNPKMAFAPNLAQTRKSLFVTKVRKADILIKAPGSGCSNILAG
jgi:hypothetical protein